MTCLECGGTMKRRRQWVPFSGLPGVQLNTFVARCQNCSASEVILPNVEDLLRVISAEIIAKRARLSGAEIRFLRKTFGWSGVDFAEHMGTTAETVSRWETGTTPIGPQADRLLRLMVLTRDPIEDYRKLDFLKNVTKAKAAAVRLAVRASDAGNWRVTDAV